MNKLVIALTLLFTTMVVISCGTETKSAQKDDGSAKVEQKDNQQQTTADISFEAYDTKGTLRNASEWIGKEPVVINLWGTWCPPCRAEVPELVKAYEAYKNKGVEFVGLAVGRDTPQKVNDFAAQNNMNWVMLMGGDGIRDLVQKYGIQSVPTTIFVDKTGKIMKVYSPRVGGLTDTYVGGLHYSQMTKYLDSLLTI